MEIPAHELEQWINGTVNVFQAEYEHTFPDRSSAPENFIYPIVIVLSIISSLLLAVSILSQRTLHSPCCYVLLSWVIVNILHVTIILPIGWTMFIQDSWTLGESGCKAFYYLQSVFMFVKAYHMPLAVIVACLSGQIESRLRERPWAVILVPIIACSCIWIIVILACIPYVETVELVKVNEFELRYCTERFAEPNTVFVAELLFHYIIPVTLSFTLLLVLGCLFIRRPSLFVAGVPKRQKTEVMSILVIVHAFLLSHIAFYVVLYNYYIIQKETFDEDINNLMWSTYLFRFSDFVAAPCICLSLPLFRDIFCLPCTLITKCKQDESQGPSIPLNEGV